MTVDVDGLYMVISIKGYAGVFTQFVYALYIHLKALSLDTTFDCNTPDDCNFTTYELEFSDKKSLEAMLKILDIWYEFILIEH